MSDYRFTPQAVGDLLDLWSFIAQDNPTAADRVAEAIFGACDFLADSPLAGRVRKELTPLPVRFWVVQPYSNYLIVYDRENKPLRIIRIVHGRSRPSVAPSVAGKRPVCPRFAPHQTRSCHSKPFGSSSAANSKWMTRRGSGFDEEDEA
jgi:plasmid stabilization system protein ParE